MFWNVFMIYVLCISIRVANILDEKKLSPKRYFGSTLWKKIQPKFRGSIAQYNPCQWRIVILHL